MRTRTRTRTRTRIRAQVNGQMQRRAGCDAEDKVSRATQPAPRNLTPYNEWHSHPRSPSPSLPPSVTPVSVSASSATSAILPRIDEGPRVSHWSDTCMRTRSCAYTSTSPSRRWCAQSHAHSPDPHARAHAPALWTRTALGRTGPSAERPRLCMHDVSASMKRVALHTDGDGTCMNAGALANARAEQHQHSLTDGRSAAATTRARTGANARAERNLRRQRAGARGRRGGGFRHGGRAQGRRDAHGGRQQEGAHALRERQRDETPVHGGWSARASAANVMCAWFQLRSSPPHRHRTMCSKRPL